MTADFTPEQAATMARFDAAPDAPESLRRRVADAIWSAWDEGEPFENVADAAIAVMRGDQ